MRPVLAAGLGNPLLTDEGIGIAVIDALADTHGDLASASDDAPTHPTGQRWPAGLPRARQAR